MGMSTRVIAFKPPGEKWQKMCDVYNACTNAGIDVPDEVSRFFDHMPPDPAGVEISERVLRDAGAVTDYSGDMSEGFDVDVTKLPRDVTVIRFYNSY
jgi:hypothetical protein